MNGMQDARAVAYRTLCLGALLKRGEFEFAVQNLDDIILFDDIREQFVSKHERLNERLCNWLYDENIDSYLSQNERHLLQKPLGAWSERSLISVGWRMEALGVMLWALHRLDTLPAYDRQFNTYEILEPLDIFNPTIDYIWLATLRSEAELQALRDQAELWNWRSRVRELERLGVRPSEGVSFHEIVRSTAEDARNKGYIPTLINGDFPVYDKAYRDLDEHEYALVSAIAYERYFALNWVCEMSSEWASVRIDT